MSTNAAAEAVYVYNKQGTIRAPMPDGMFEIMLDVKLVQQNYATPDSLVTLGGAAAKAREEGFELKYVSAQALGIETLNEITGQWRPVPSGSTFAVIASLPD